MLVREDDAERAQFRAREPRGAAARPQLDDRALVHDVVVVAVERQGEHVARGPADAAVQVSQALVLAEHEVVAVDGLVEPRERFVIFFRDDDAGPDQPSWEHRGRSLRFSVFRGCDIVRSRGAAAHEGVFCLIELQVAVRGQTSRATARIEAVASDHIGACNRSLAIALA